MTWKKVAVIAILVLALGFPGAARADLIINGGFESYTPGRFASVGFPTGDLAYSPVTGWRQVSPDSAGSATGNLLFTPGSADTTGVIYDDTPFGGGVAGFGLWGPGLGVNNALPATSPAGGNFLGLDADPAFSGALSQTVNGLTAGKTYLLSFDWAAAQLSTTSGPTTEQLKVTFGSQPPQSTTVLNNPSQGFSGWKQQTFTFTADGPSDSLTFLALGGPAGLPPFVLLDGVSLNPTATGSGVPEPATVLLVSLGLLGIGVARRLRKRARPATV